MTGTDLPALPAKLSARLRSVPADAELQRVAFVMMNLISTLLECGLGACPDNPTDHLRVLAQAGNRFTPALSA